MDSSARNIQYLIPDRNLLRKTDDNWGVKSLETLYFGNSKSTAGLIADDENAIASFQINPGPHNIN